MGLYGYARVSTLEQNVDLQVNALTAAGCERVWVERVSGATARRPELTALLDYIRAGDTLVVWRLDRLGRSLTHLVSLLADLGTRDVGFQSLTEGMDTTTPIGRLLFHVSAAFAEFERSLIRERTLAGLDAARTAGRLGGRRPVLTGQRLAYAREKVAAGESKAAVARVLGVSRTTVARAVAA